MIPLHHQRLPEEEMRERARQFLALVSRRRTVRDFSTEPVPMDVVENAILAAGRAPSGANQQPWTFCVVTNPELKRRIREAAEAEERENYSGRMSAEWREAVAHLGTDAVKPHLTDAPVLIVVFEQTHGFAPAADGGEPARVRHYYSKESVGLATGFLLAALHQAGLATLTHTPSPMGFLGELLGRPRNEKAFVLVPVGYPAPECRVPAIGKKSRDEIIVRFD
jgi:nitroreductase